MTSSWARWRLNWPAGESPRNKGPKRPPRDLANHAAKMRRLRGGVLLWWQKSNSADIRAQYVGDGCVELPKWRLVNLTTPCT